MLALAIPLIAGFFAVQKKSFDFGHLSTQWSSKSGAIMKADKKTSVFGFLTTAFEARIPQPEPRAPKETTNESIGSIIRNLESGNFSVSTKSTPTSNDDTTRDAAQQEPSLEPARSLWRYFSASSAIGFGNDTNALASAISYATRGNSDPLTAFTLGLARQLDALRALEPPHEARDIHEQSISLLSRYIDFLQLMASSPANEISSLWDSPQHTALIKESSAVLAVIEDLETKFGFSLPEDVLPRR